MHDFDIQSTARQARSLLDKRRYAEAAPLYRRLVDDPNTVEQSYDDWVRGLARCLAQLGQVREASYLWLYLQSFDQGLSLLSGDHWLDRARILAAKTDHRAAAKLYESGGKLVQAAINYEKAGEAQLPRGPQPGEAIEEVGPADPDAPIRNVSRQVLEETYGEARRCWDRLRSDERLRGRSYELALVNFNLGTCALKLGDDGGHGFMVTSQRLLEEAADGFETIGQRERAFDCYQILLEIGRRSGAFENLAEGFINCVRILKEDNLKYYVLQYYEDFLREAMSRGEFHAAATLYRNAADFCLRSGLIYDRYYMKAAAETWMKAAEKTMRDGGVAEMAENAALAAVEGLNAIGDYPRVGATYRWLGDLEGLQQRRRERYAKIALRYDGAQATGGEPPPFPEYLRQSHAYPEIWYMDLVEWEHDGDIIAVCAAVVGDTRYPDVVRRRALNLLLQVLEGAANHPAGLAQIAERLGDLQIYTVLSVLEKLYESSEPQVQRGVMKAVQYLFFKRSFVVLMRGLASTDEAVRTAAVESLGRLHFNHAFDPLVRIFREMENPLVRRTALVSIGQIPQLQAGDFLIEVLRYEPDPLRSEAKRLLANFQNRELFPILRQHYEMEAGSVRNDMEEILRQVGA
ncbi:MAG: HEAT repeat domain-containing protein [Myxococcales bacterium]|nr:HEAT repeat domain-containing protein [Myxococcales bacterium]